MIEETIETVLEVTASENRIYLPLMWRE